MLLIAALLFTFSFLFNKLYVNRSSVAQEVKLAEKYIHDKHEEFFSFCKDTSLINRLLGQAETLHEFNQLASKKFGVFLYSVDEFGNYDMRLWNDQLVVPPLVLLNDPDGEYFSRELNGSYYVIKKTLTDSTRLNQVLAFAMIPVRSEFFITTDYLPQKFFYSNSADKRVAISKTENDFPVKTGAGKKLFYLEKKASQTVAYNDRRTILLRFGGVIFLFLFIHLLAESVARRKKTWKAIGLLTVVLLVLRLLTYYYPSLLNLRQFELFSPVIYGSNAIQRSLGDLLINSILFCWVVLFAWSKLRYIDDPTTGFSPRLRWITGILALCLLIFSTFILATVIHSLVADSKISFDVTNFFSLNRYTVVGFFVLACLSLSYYYFSQLLFRLIFPLFEERKFLIYFAISFAGLIYLTIRPGHADVLFYLPVLLWLLVYTWLVNRKGVVFNRIRINIAGILSWIFVFSVSITVIMFSQNRKAEWVKRKLIAEKLSDQTDPASERMMSIAITYLDSDFLTDNFNRFKVEDEGIRLRDSIITGNYSGYLNKYYTRLYVYDSSGLPLFNEDQTTLEALNAILSVQSKPTNTEGLYYYETSFDKFNYITRREVLDTAGRKLGSFFIVSNFKNYSRDALFPELFRQFKETDPENSPIYSNAVYDSMRLVSPPGNYPYPIWLTTKEVPKEEFELRVNGDFDELWYRAGTEKVVVVARKKETTIEMITLFSYIFCSFLFLVAFVQLITFILRTGYNWRGFKRLFQLNIRSQVHSTIIFISIFSFLVIGAATISFFISRNKQSNGEKLSRTMKIMVNEMEKEMSNHNTFDDVIKIYDSVSNDNLQRLVNEVSDIHGVDVNVYDLKGDLQVSSEANVYTKGVLSKKMDPAAFYHLNRMRQVQHSQEEKIGNFSYLSIYSPVRDGEGKVYAYINIPYFTSKPELRQEISNFLVTIINLNAFIFLIAGLIALFITNRITNSFSIISDKMREVNLGRHNEEIVWNRSDEIGELVQEYNKMVAKLGESATALAKSEREGAWREMARQVAHEIKNPLTPMKLSIQYLQKAINNNQPNVKELSSNVANTLVEQIDHLSKIAADFSQFANIGTTNITSFDLHDVLSSLKELFKSDENVLFEWRPVNDQVMVEADKTQMNRLFTNLFANAVEACQGNGNRCRIEVSELRHENTIRVSIKDNGEGIAPEMQERIFIPNFTTKSSGTGLGLAMCMGIVEQAHGKIWFETEQGKGTVFHVELPVVN
ncbi:MAG TPA: HAMP domain-containing sensor histidine kinase [Chitinophagaceae bacterium]|jgi:signal transduction histidine kinase|nr:HAMP domain-containing sensor histidine kinase [Chitinophagaceae bacterium]